MSARIGPLLAPEQRVQAWLEQRGGYAYAGETGAERLSLGQILRAHISGHKVGLTDLERRVLHEGLG